MTYEILYSTVVAILTAIITGGFILVLWKSATARIERWTRIN